MSLGIGLDPRVLLHDGEVADYEELYPAIDNVPQTVDIVLLAVRALIILIFLVCLIIVIADIAKDNLRLKSWRLYLVVCFSLFCWLGLSIYQVKIYIIVTKFLDFLKMLFKSTKVLKNPTYGYLHRRIPTTCSFTGIFNLEGQCKSY